MNGDKKYAQTTNMSYQGRENPLVPWQDAKQLRRPHGYSGPNQQAEESEFGTLSNTRQVDLTSTSDKKQHVWRLDLPEFCPKNMQTSKSSNNVEPPSNITPPKHSVQKRLDLAREMPPIMNVEQVTPDHTQDISQSRNNSQNPQTYVCNSYNNSVCEDEESCYKEVSGNIEHQLQDFEILQRLEEIIIAVTSNPGDFDLFSQFVSNFRENGNLKCLQKVVTVVFEWSITESNFRYSGARFCTYFNSTSEPDEQDFFRSVLYYTCKLESKIQEIEWQKRSEENFDQRKCYGLILFLAELVAQMDKDFASDISEILLVLIVKILRRPTSDITKYICQVLKLIGPKLEEDQSKDQVSKVENVMQLLSELVIGKKVNEQVGKMIDNIHELRSNDWGMSNSGSFGMNTAPLQQVQQEASDEPGTSNRSSATNVVSAEHQPLDKQLVYGPDGPLMLSAEESEFLHNQLQPLYQREFKEFYEVEDNDFDDEIAEAYEEFLKERQFKVKS